MSMYRLQKKQKLFAKHYSDPDSGTFENATASAIKAGYAESGASALASRLLKDPKIQEYIQFLGKTMEQLFAEKAKDMLAVLESIAEDKKAPSASRVASAKDLLDRAGYGATKKIDAKVNVAGSLVTSTETTIIQNIINKNDDVAETILEAIRARQRPVVVEEDKI